MTPTGRTSGLCAALCSDDTGATMSEYAVLLAIVSIALVGAMQVFSSQISAVFSTAASNLGTAK